MDIIISPRQSGKTTYLIKKSSEDGGVIVCQSEREVVRLLDLAKTLNLQIPTPITYIKFIDGEYHNRSSKIFHIDNFDLMIKTTMYNKVKTITISSDSVSDIISTHYKASPFSEIKCNYIECYAGLGVAGMLSCFLGGNYKNPKCQKYVNEDEELKKQEKAAQNCD